MKLSKRGFTLVELLIVVGILAVIAAIAVPSVAGLIDRSNKSADQTNATEMTNAIERFTSEYELTRQEILSGNFNEANLDAASGRVVNAIGIRSLQDIGDVEKDGYSTANLVIDRGTKYPLNEKTVKMIIQSYLKASSSIFAPKKSNYAFYYSPELGVVVYAEQDASISDLNRVAFAENITNAAGNEWINLTINADKNESDWEDNVWVTNTKGSYTTIDNIVASRPSIPETPTQPNPPSQGGNQSGGTPSGGNQGGTPSGGSQGGAQNGGQSGGQSPSQPTCTHANTELRGKTSPSCTDAGYSGDKWCKDCNTEIQKGTTVPATGHNNIEYVDKTPTFSGDKVCADCGEFLEAGKEVGHNAAIIPEGGVYYYSILNECPDCGYILDAPSTDDNEVTCRVCGNPSIDEQYWNNGSVRYAGEEFPQLHDGDIYVYGDYEYRFNCVYDGDAGAWCYASMDGWSTKVLDEDQDLYDDPIKTINKKDLRSCTYTWAFCRDLTVAPAIPDTVIYADYAFFDCEILYSIPEDILPENIISASQMFAYTSLSNSYNSAYIIPDSLEYSDCMFESCRDIFIKGPESGVASLSVMRALAQNPQNVLVSVYKDDVFFDLDCGVMSAGDHSYYTLVESRVTPVEIHVYDGGNYRIGSVRGGNWVSNTECYACGNDEQIKTFEHLEEHFGYDSYGILADGEDITYSSDGNDGFFSRFYPDFYGEFTIQCSYCEGEIYITTGEYPEVFDMDVDIDSGKYELYVMPYNHYFTQTHEDYIIIEYLY